MSDLQMKSCPDDSNASAIILCDYGESTFGDDLDIVFTRHLRVKVLTTKGYEKGNVHAIIHTGDGFEKISGIEGATYNLNANGKIITTELRSKDIFKEEINDNVTKYSFALPALAPGCVFELRYKIKVVSFHWWYMRDWTFQSDEPVRWSEYRMRYPKKISYTVMKLGYEPYFVDEHGDTTQYFGSSSSVSYFNGLNVVPCWNHRWVVKDAPAIREEAYMTTRDDYVNKIDVQLAGFIQWDGAVEHILNSWDKLADDLTDDANFLKCINDTRKIKKQTEQLITVSQTAEEKMIAIYNWVSRNIVCSYDGIYAKPDLDDVLDAKKGNVADVTFLFLAMLKCAGIDGNPVLLSTRDNGKIQESYPMLSQFNYVLAKIDAGTKSYYVSPTDPNRPFDLLPSRVLGVTGFVVKPHGFDWVLITTPKKYTYTSVVSVTIDSTGVVKGSFENLLKDYGALSIRLSLKDKKDIEVIKKKFDTEENGFTIDSTVIEGKDDVDQPIKLKAWVSSPSYAQANADMIYINPCVMDRYTQNPFKMKNRKYPIDYPYQYSLTTVCNIQIPEGYEVKEKVANHDEYFRGDLLSFSVKCQVQDNLIQVLTKYQVNTNAVKAIHYKQLTEFYDAIAAAESEQIVLKRIPPPVAPIQEIKQQESTTVATARAPKANQENKSAKKKDKK